MADAGLEKVVAPIEELYMPMRYRCPNCGGHGVVQAERHSRPSRCPECDGDGWREAMVPFAEWLVIVREVIKGEERGA
jgi:DnaJ-class molecular chaperone